MVVQETESQPVVTANIKRKSDGRILYSFELRIFSDNIYLLEELAGGRPQKHLKEGLSEKTLWRRYNELNALVENKCGMRLLIEIVAYE